MTSLLGARRHAEAFAAFVDGRSTPADPQADLADLAELAGVVEALRAHVAPEPRPEFSAALRERLLAEADISLATGSVLRLPTRRSGARERRLALLASSVVLVGGTAGMAAASQGALPGEPLYPIKRGIERAQVEVGTSETSKGQDLLEQADSRLVEVRELMEESVGSPHVPGTIEQFIVQFTEGTDLLLESFEEDRDPAVITELHGFTAEALSQLQELATLTPADHQSELAQAAAVLVQTDRRLLESCASCVPESELLQLPELFLTAEEVEQVTVDGDDRPTLPVVAPQPPGQGDPSGTTADGQPADGEGPRHQPPAPQPPTVSQPSQDTEAEVEAPGDAVDETVNELPPEEHDPVVEPTDPAPSPTDPAPSPTDPAPSPVDPSPSPTDPSTGPLADPEAGSLPPSP